jgi:UDPglucose 6-dehydrogenase
MKLSVIGLGKMGAPMLACFASKGFEVIGVDADQNKIRAINGAQYPPVDEPGLQELLVANIPRIVASADIEDAVLKTDITFVIVATPSQADGKFSLEYVFPVCEKIAQALRNKNTFHTVVITSTVMPGDCDGPIKETLERVSGLKCGEGFGLCYNPEFIALGSVIKDFLNPDFVLLGAEDPLSECRIKSVYSKICAAPVKTMSRINAEIAKLSLNSFITMKISFANMIARICERLPGADVDVVTSAIGSDSRIGSKYLKGSVNYGGPCFPRDNRALAVLAEELGTSPDLPKTVDRFNRFQIQELANLVENTAKGPVAVLGMSYKLGTSVIEESTGILLLEELRDRKIPIDSCISDNTNMVVVTLPFKDLSSIECDWSTKTLVDCWRSLSYLKPYVKKYIGLGQG